MNPFGVLADSDEIVDPTDVTFFKFTGLVPDAKVALQKQQPFDINKYPACVSLIAVSSKYGYFAAATVEGFTFGTTKSLRSAIYKADKGSTVTLDDNKITVQLSSRIRQIRFSADETQLLVATEGGVLQVYNVADIKTVTNSFNLGQEIIDLRPNPEAIPNLAAVLFDNHHVKLVDTTNGSTVCELPLDNISAICWSPKGKQIVCGKLDGSLEHYDSKGTRKDTLPIPELMSERNPEEPANRSVQDILWIENHLFLVFYARSRQSNEDEFINDGYIINRKPGNNSNEPLYIRLAEITPIFTTEGRGNHFYMEVIRDLGKEIKHLVIIANAATGEMSVVGHNEHGEWATWALPENGVVNLPLSEKTSFDTYPVGLALDLSADEKLPPFDAAENDVGVEPMPIFYYINDEGDVAAYHCYNIELARRGESFAAYSAAASASTSSTSTAAPAAVTQPATSAFSAFGATTTTSGGSFGDLLSGKGVTSPPATSAFGGFGGFGTSGGNIPSFANLGSAQKIPAAPSTGGFGALNPATTAAAAAPTFGSTTNIGFSTNKSTTTTTDKPLSAFGTALKTDQVVPDKPAFGGFNTTGTPTAIPPVFPAQVPENKPAATGLFGSTSAEKPATSFFGSTSSTKPTTPAFGSTSSFGSTSALGTTTATPSFGSSSSSESNTPTVKAPAFGSTSTLGAGGFGSLAKNTVPGATAPSFGSTSTLSNGGFGSLAKNTVPGAIAPSNTPSTGGFGALAKNTVPGSTTPSFGSTSNIGTGGFGSLAKNTVPAAVTPANKPLFGTPSALGSNTFGSSSITTNKDTATVSPPKPSTMATPIPVTVAAKPAETKPITAPELAKPSQDQTVPTKTLPPVSSPTAASSPAPVAPVTKPKEKMKPTAEEGMAKEFEALYITVTESIDELSLIHKNVSAVIEVNTSSTPKTESDLTSSDWKLSNVSEYAAMTDRILASIQNDQLRTAQVKQEIDSLTMNGKKSMDKKEDIKYLLHKQKEVDSVVVDLMDNRELDAETKAALNTLEKKSQANQIVVHDLEFKVEEYKKRNKIKHDHQSGDLTLYSLHRALRDIQKDITSRNNDLRKLEESYAILTLNQSKRRAKQSSSAISAGDLTDSEEENEEDEKVSPAAIEHTKRYLRRLHFLNNICVEASTRPPLVCPIDE